MDTEHWLNWTQDFGPLSGFESRLDDASDRYITTVFCYGCLVGPSQTARSLNGNNAMNRRQIAWLHQHHLTEDKLQAAITTLINGYNRFLLPKQWGSGKSASADGTKWDLYEQNLLAENHIRYGGYGGIAYYHVSDNYIALFSRFIPCGVWEAVYILDALMENKSDIQPDTLHGDTQAQNSPVFGLAHLLGIELMPRIRNLKDLKFYRSTKEQYQNIDSLFSDTINWSLIETHLRDILRVVLSIRAGRISASTILKKLGTYSRKNKLYQAMRELGRVIRTIFLLKYINEPELRRVINAATNKSESFNKLAKWLAFGGEGAQLRENNREKQRKLIRYNHLVANCLIFHNVQAMTKILHEAKQEGVEFTNEDIACVNPYLTLHLNRLGKYWLNRNRKPQKLDYALEWG